MSNALYDTSESHDQEKIYRITKNFGRVKLLRMYFYGFSLRKYTWKTF